jgi:hypothetical protein
MQKKADRQSDITTASLPLALAAPQGCVALCAPVLRTPLPRAGFAVAGYHTTEQNEKGTQWTNSRPCPADPDRSLIR